MPGLDDALPYVAAGISLAAGIFGFFWARGGERNKIGGIGWTALVFLVAASIVTITQTYRQGRRTAAAGEKAEALNTELRRAQHVTRSALLTVIGGFDVRSPIEQAVLYFELPYEGAGEAERPLRIERFVGPFPELPTGASARLIVNLDRVAYADYRLAPAAGGLRLTSVEPGGQAFTLRRGGDAFQFAPEEHVGPGWSAGPETTHGRNTYNYALTISGQNQLRRLVWLLSTGRSYGRIELVMPGATDADIDRIVQSYARMTVRLVVRVATLPESGAAEGEAAPAENSTATAEPCEPSYIRVPVVISREPTTAPGRVSLNIGPAVDGFDPEFCEGDV